MQPATSCAPATAMPSPCAAPSCTISIRKADEPRKEPFNDCDRRSRTAGPPPLALRAGPHGIHGPALHRACHPLRRAAGGLALLPCDLLQRQRLHDLQSELSLRRLEEPARGAAKRHLPPYARQHLLLH